MLFHIFGFSKDSDFKVKSRENLATNQSDYTACLDKFDYLISNENYTDLYLVIEFGTYKPAIVEWTKIDLSTRTFPFIVVDEYHIDKTYNHRNDNLIISMDGFVQEFDDNRIAIKKLVENIDSKIFCNLSMSIDQEQFHITDTKSILQNNGTNIKRFNLIANMDRAL